MTNTKHTPGPWNRNIPPATKYATIYSGRNTHIAYVTNSLNELSGEEVEANMNLIVAAPDLLEALETLINAPVCKVENKPLWRKAAEAIAKARDSEIESKKISSSAPHIQLGVPIDFVAVHDDGTTAPFSFLYEHDDQCSVCGDHHEGNVPFPCETGDGV
jgi:hypothetical protein